tara:strand:- start:2069 stop:3163 length:1095 start_codon:yes stop_codon:yes gene_type:complete
MVNNESHVIERMLESVYPYIDYWVIQDNGSTDGTQDIIKNFFKEKEIPGFLYELDWWKGHGVNRDHCIRTALEADHGCDWILRVDADEQLQVADDFDWSVFNDTSIQSWNVPCQGPGIMYFRTWLWNAKEPWRFYPEKAHETIYLDRDDIGESFQRVNLDKKFRHILTNDGQTWLQPMKFLKDALNLELDTIPNNKVLEDDYHLFYIAKSYHDTLRDNFPFGQDHRDEFARRCIFYFKQHLYKVHPQYKNEKVITKTNDEFSYWDCLGIGNSYVMMGQEQRALKWYERAHGFCPSRNEAFVKIAQIHEDSKDYHRMLNATKMLVDINRKNPFPNFQFLIEDTAYSDTSNYPFELHNKALQGINV